MTDVSQAPAGLLLPPGCAIDPEGLRNMAERTPAQRALGARLVALGPRSATIGVGWRKDLVEDNAGGGLAGGVISTALDQASGLAMMMNFNGQRASAGTVELRLEYMAPPRAGQPVHAHAECVGSNAHAAFMRCASYHPDTPGELLATGSAIFMTDNAPLNLGPPPKPRTDAPDGEPADDATPSPLPYPYIGFLGLQKAGDDAGMFVLPGEFRHINNTIRKSLHGGVLAAALQNACLDHLRREHGTTPGTLCFTTGFLRRAELRDTWIKVSAVREGRRLATLRVNAWQETGDKPVAFGHGQFLLA